MRRDHLLGGAFVTVIAGCGGGATSDTGPADQTVQTAVASCSYANKFNSETECKDYVGEAWTVDQAEVDCTTANLGDPGVFSAGTGCDLSPTLGHCSVSVEPGFEYTVLLGGDDASLCAGAELACTTFAGGAFIETGVCVAPEGEDGHTVFIWPYESCEPPIEGEESGDGPDGTVCAWNSISGCTEEGRDFRDYGSCDVVFTNRPYYALDPYGESAADDPRLSDAAYMAELAWVTEQTKACACVCCHTGDAPDGPAIWGIDGDPLWPDMMSDIAIGMFAGYIDSSALGAYPPELNNGFDRTNSAMPTTDPVRMVDFWLGEFDRRGLSADDMSNELPVGNALLEQIDFDLPDCSGKDGVAADGTITWASEFDARYLYILEEGSANPGVPPNFDMPDGVLWRVDIPHDGTPLASGVRYGVLPGGAIQMHPADTKPPELDPGQRYHLYVLYDVALPIARCVFELAPESGSKGGGCSVTGGGPLGPASLWLLGAVALTRRRRAGTSAVIST